MTILDDRLLVLGLAALTEDRDKKEDTAFRREVLRAIGEAHAQLSINRLLVRISECEPWSVTAEPGDMFVEPALVTLRGQHVYRPGDLIGAGRWAARSLTGMLCSFPGGHDASCPCAGDGVSRPIAAGRLSVLPDGGWLLPSMFGLE